MRRSIGTATRLMNGGVLGFDLRLQHRVPASDRTPSARLAPRELAARMIIVTLFTAMVVRVGADFLQTGRITGLLLVASEALVVVLTVLRRPTHVVDRSAFAGFVTTLSLIGPPLIRPAAVAPFAPAFATVAVSALGLLVVICGKLSLGRSFGLLPANRGVVSTGLYRLVRHPIYMGYLVTHVGFVAANPTTWNVMTLGIADLALMVRAVCEERTLALDPQYREYQTRVRWRVVPGLF